MKAIKVATKDTDFHGDIKRIYQSPSVISLFWSKFVNVLCFDTILASQTDGLLYFVIAIASYTIFMGDSNCLIIRLSMILHILYTVSQKQLWNGIARNFKDWFWWYLAEIFRALDSREAEPSTVTVLWQDVAVVEEFVYLGSLIHSTTQISPAESWYLRLQLHYIT